jgi:hypothetical protein
MQVVSCDIVVQAPNEQGDRAVVCTLDAEGEKGTLENVRLDIDLLDSRGGVLQELRGLEPGLVRPGRQLLSARVVTRLPATVASARWQLTAREVTWRGPVRALAEDAERVPPLAAPAPAHVLAAASAQVRRVAPTPTATPSRRMVLPSQPAPPPLDPRWLRVEEADLSVVEDAFVGTELDMDGRERVRELLRSSDPVRLELGCRICTVTGWRTAAQTMRTLLRHPAPGVRAAAAEGIGLLAGPAMEHYLKPLSSDPDPAVREAAAEAIERLQG